MSGEFWSVQLTTLLLHEQMEVMCKMYCEVRSTCKSIQMYMKKVLYIQRIVICIYNELLFYVKCTARCVLLMCE